MKTHKTNLEKTMTAMVFGGVAIMAGALLWPLSDNLRAAPLDATPASVRIEEPITVRSAVAPSMGGDAADAMEIAEAMEIAGDVPSVAIKTDDTETDFAAEARDLLGIGDTKGALNSLRKHLHKVGGTPMLLRRIAKLARETKQYAIGEQALAAAKTLDISDSETYVDEARLFLAMDDIDRASKSATKAVRFDKDSANAWNLAGRVAMAQNHWQRAEAALSKAADLDPTQPILHNNLGLLYIKMRVPEGAIAALEEAVELYGDEVPPFVLNNLGLAYEQDEALLDAQASFEQALEADPMYVRARVNLDRILSAVAELEPEEVAAEASEAEAADAADELKYVPTEVAPTGAGS